MANKETTYEKTTGALYGSLFTAYDEQKFDESVALFETRHKRWGIDLEWFKGKSCLDAGCGGGRYLVALARLGASQVTGIDISQPAVDAANARLQSRGLSNVALARLGSVLELPVADASFDYVVSSGVIHHTPNPKQGFDELTRVLKPGGKLFLSVYGRGGLFWMVNDIGRLIARVVPFAWMEAFWKALGIPANKRYNYMDNLYVPYCARFTEKEIREWLRQAGFENIQRVKFERYDYEKLWSRFMYGQGWLQFYADKKPLLGSGITETPVLKLPLKPDWRFVPTEIESETGGIYDDLFSAYDEKRFEESVELFPMRQQKWGVPLDWFKGKVCLDVGCGQGRFVTALGRLGAAKAIGVDINQRGLAAGRSRRWFKELNNVELMRASALDLPFQDGYFDYVISSGVLLLCPEPKLGFAELVRVTKPGGRIFLSMYGSGGIKWMIYDVARATVGRFIPHRVTLAVFKFLGFPPNKRYNLLDDVYTPYSHRYTEAEVRQWFEAAGFEKPRRVKFERYDYEKFWNRVYHGEGWLQLMADKKTG